MKEINKSDIIRDKLSKSQKPPLKVYKELTIGNVSFSKFLYYEFVSFFLGPMPGGLIGSITGFRGRLRLINLLNVIGEFPEATMRP